MNNCIKLSLELKNKRKPKLTQEEVKYYLDYNPLTGNFIRKVATSSGTYEGQIAGNLNPIGYVVIGIKGGKFLAHRLIWLWMTGKFPEKEIDHINGNREDNRWENLRESTQQQNSCNRKRLIKNITDVKGIIVRNRNGIIYYTGRIALNYKCYYKCSHNIEEIKQWLKKKRNELHKDFANHG